MNIPDGTEPNDAYIDPNAEPVEVFFDSIEDLRAEAYFTTHPEIYEYYSAIAEERLQRTLDFNAELDQVPIINEESRKLEKKISRAKVGAYLVGARAIRGLYEFIVNKDPQVLGNTTLSLAATYGCMVYIFNRHDDIEYLDRRKTEAFKRAKAISSAAYTVPRPASLELFDDFVD